MRLKKITAASLLKKMEVSLSPTDTNNGKSKETKQKSYRRAVNDLKFVVKFVRIYLKAIQRELPISRISTSSVEPSRIF